MIGEPFPRAFFAEPESDPCGATSRHVADLYGYQEFAHALTAFADTKETLAALGRAASK